MDRSIARDKSTWESGQSFWLVSHVGDQSEWTDLSPGISLHGNLDSLLLSLLVNVYGFSCFFIS